MPKKILLVDDEQRILDILNQFLTREGFEVMMATDGYKALEMARKDVPDLILLDVMMPVIDGGEVMERILEDEQLRYVPVIFLTGMISQEESAIYDEMSTGRRYMSKAGNIKEQIKAIKKILGVT